jgi:hypothetical protein
VRRDVRCGIFVVNFAKELFFKKMGYTFFLRLPPQPPFETKLLGRFSLEKNEIFDTKYTKKIKNGGLRIREIQIQAFGPIGLDRDVGSLPPVRGHRRARSNCPTL